VQASSARFKKDIRQMGTASQAILALKPVTFQYKEEFDPRGIPQFGLIAEEVAKISPNLVSYDADGHPFTVRYDSVNAMPLNEFLKAHSKIDEQQGTIAQLKSTVSHQQKQIEALAAVLQRVAAQVEVRKPATKIVNTN
jgi:hypothetical protein